MCMDATNKRILLGTEGGNVYLLNLWNFKIDESIIFQDLVMKNSPEDFKVNPGAVEALLLHPTENDKILLAYARGLIVIWDRKEEKGNITLFFNIQNLMHLKFHQFLFYYQINFEYILLQPSKRLLQISN